MPISFAEACRRLKDDLHLARHLTVEYPDVDNESPLLDMGWAPGVLLGVHLACEYPKAAARLNRVVFADPEFTGANMAADALATAIFEQILRPKSTSEEDFQRKLDELRGNYHDRSHD
jgi:hypothetical protein